MVNWWLRNKWSGNTSLSACRVEYVSKINCMFIGSRYISVLEHALVPNVDMLRISYRWKFCQDNASCHPSRVVKVWFDK